MLFVLVLAAARLLLHLLTNHNYGFHRDELAYLDDGMHLDWGFAGYPPMTPAIGRVALELFGLSPNGVRLFAALAQCAAIVITGDMARRLGGNRFAQFLAALCVAAAPLSIGAGALFQYVTFDYLWWTLLAWSVARLLVTEDPRWWLAIGAAAGLGLMNKYAMAFFLIALGAALVATPARRLLFTRWFAAGALLGLAIFLPNLIWQVRHDFVSLDFLRSIHERDIRIGRTGGFLWKQAIVGSTFSLPLAVAGLWFYWRRPNLRSMAVWFVAILALLAALQGRDYYMAGAYPLLFAAGAVAASNWRPAWRNAATAFAALGLVVFPPVLTPMAPIGSPWFHKVSELHGDLKEEVGWPELTDAVARVYQALPPEERAAAGILVGNYGEAGAINLYGGKYGLPRAMSGINSHWLRGYTQPPAKTVVAMGFREESLRRWFESVELAGRVEIPYGVKNEEAGKPEIYICRGMRQSWPEFWKNFRYFG